MDERLFTDLLLILNAAMVFANFTMMVANWRHFKKIRSF